LIIIFLRLRKVPFKTVDTIFVWWLDFSFFYLWNMCHIRRD